MNRLTNLASSTQLRIPSVGLAVLIALGAFGVSGAPGIAPAAAAAAPASSRVLTSYLLRSSLSYATGTITTSETITIRNTTGESITSINLSVMPRAFGELVSLSQLRLDDVAVTGTWTNTSNLRVDFGRSLAPDATAKLTLSFVVKANSTIGTSLEGRLSKANGIMQVAHWFPIVSDGQVPPLPGRCAVDPHRAQDPRRDHDRLDVGPDRGSRPSRQPRRPDPRLRARVRPRLRVRREPVLQVGVRHRGRRPGPGLVHDR